MTSTYVLDLSGPRVVADAKAAYATPGPLTTVWLDVARATESAHHEIELRWRGLLDALDEHRAPQRHVELLRQLSESRRDVPGTARRTVVVGNDGVVLDITHETETTSQMGWEAGSLPRLVPLLEEATSWVPYVLVEVGHTEGVMHLRVAGRAGDWVERVEGEDEPARKVGPRAGPSGTGRRTWTRCGEATRPDSPTRRAPRGGRGGRPGGRHRRAAGPEPVGRRDQPARARPGRPGGHPHASSRRRRQPAVRGPHRHARAALPGPAGG